MTPLRVVERRVTIETHLITTYPRQTLRNKRKFAMTRNLVVHAGLALSIILTTGTLQAQQDRLLADLYGRGVHAYFDGQF